jgi:Uma2 family endonuclease
MADDPLLASIPFKLELNEKGSIVVTPAGTRHSFLQAFVTGELTRLLPNGTTFTECPVETSIGVRVPDVAWASAEFMRRHGLADPLPSAPEICIEVLSPSNSPAEISEKVAAYLAAGAREVWLVPEDGTVEILSARGRASSSAFGIELELPRSCP